VPDWVKNLFRDFPERKNVSRELSEARSWAQQVIHEANRRYYRDPYWTEYPLIQREVINTLKGDHLFIYRYIRSNPTIDLYHLYLNSGYDEDTFYRTVNDLVQYNYLRIFSVYYSIEYSNRQPACRFFNNNLLGYEF